MGCFIIYIKLCLKCLMCVSEMFGSENYKRILKKNKNKIIGNVSSHKRQKVNYILKKFLSIISYCSSYE